MSLAGVAGAAGVAGVAGALASAVASLAYSRERRIARPSSSPAASKMLTIRS